MKKYLYILCDAGLCNRLHAIAGAKYIAHHTFRELRIWWPVNDMCGAKFKRLFENPLLPDGTPTYKFMTSDDMATILSTRNRVRVYNCGLGVTATDECYHIPHGDEYEHMVIKSWYTPKFSWKGFTGATELDQRMNHYISMYCRDFTPVVDIRRAYNNVPRARRELGQGPIVVGLHLRYGDPDLSKPGQWLPETLTTFGRSNLAEFEKGVRLIIEKHPRVHFRIASPNPEMSEKLRDMWSDYATVGSISRIVVAPRTTVHGMRQAVEDLWSLSECDLILGSEQSQYSEFAARIGAGKLIRVGTDGWLQKLETVLETLDVK